MQSDDVTKPVGVQELRQRLEEWAAIAARMIDLLHETADCDGSRDWRPHLAQIVTAVDAFGDRCRSDSRELGFSRTDYLDADETLGRARAQGQRLVAWLQRMIPE